MYDFNVEDFMAERGVYDDKLSELSCAHLGYILKDINDIKSSYIQLGFHLAEFKRCEDYYAFGYFSFEDFVQEKLGLDKSALSRCLNVYYEFADVQKGTRKMWIAEKWKDYSYSQLCEMLSMDDIQRRQVSPNMTVKQIRELKKSKKKESQQEDVTNHLCVMDLLNSGIVLQNRIKAVSSLRSFVLRVFDCDGKEIKNLSFSGQPVELLFSSDRCMIIRLYTSKQDSESV